jgi:hypothetical protein
MEEARELGFAYCTVEAIRTGGARPGRNAEVDKEVAMKRLPVPQIPPETVDVVRLSVAAGRSQEEVFAQMRRLGLFMGKSIKLTSQIYGISLGDAQTRCAFQ